jgi:hypothetical protein
MKSAKLPKLEARLTHIGHKAYPNMKAVNDDGCAS